jgi:C4-dicarboxylate transporter
MACTEVHVTYGVATWAIIAAVVLMFLAQRFIKKDEEKVRAADRLR